MIDLSEDNQQALRDLVRAGAEGLELGTEFSLGAALLFGINGLCTITNAKQPPQRAVATKQARVMAFRSAA